MDDLEVLQTGYEALVNTDLAVIIGLLAEDVVAHVPGRSQVAGEYVGMEAVVGYVSTLMELSDATLRFQTHSVQTDGRHGVVLINDKAERDGKTPLDMNNVHVWHVSEGKLKEIWIYPEDLYQWDEFWA